MVSVALVMAGTATFIFMTQRRAAYAIYEVEQLDSDTLRVEGHCGLGSEVDLHETADEVRLRHTARRPIGERRLLCLAYVHVELGKPLGGRSVVDEASGRKVAVRQPDDS